MFELNKTLTFQGFLLLWEQIREFLITLGNIGCDFSRVVVHLLKLKVNFKEVIEQS